MGTRRKPQPPKPPKEEQPPELVDLIQAARALPPDQRPTVMLDALCDDVVLRDWLLPEGTEHDASAWTHEWSTFSKWAKTDMDTPMPYVAHMIEGKLAKQGIETTTKMKGQRRKRDRTASDEDIDAYCDALLAMPEYASVGWTFALRLMRYLGAGSEHTAFRDRFEMAQQRAGVTSKRGRRKPKNPAA